MNKSIPFSTGQITLDGAASLTPNILGEQIVVRLEEQGIVLNRNTVYLFQITLVPPQDKYSGIYELHEVGSQAFCPQKAKYLKSISSLWHTLVLRYTSPPVHKTENLIGHQIGWEAVGYTAAHRQYFSKLIEFEMSMHLFDLWAA